jgi:uncharacterized protein
MSDFDRNIAARGGFAGRAVAIDAGLRAHMIRVYNYMASAVALTGVVAWLTFNAAVVTNASGTITGLTAFGQLIFNPVAMIVLLLGTFGLVIFISARIHRLDYSTALVLFMVYAGVLGLMLSPIFLQYTGASITRVFFISAAMFGGMSLWGYTTQRDLTSFGAFMTMGLYGIVIAMLVNIVLGLFGVNTGPLDFVISIIGVVVFAGLTAWNTQQVKETYDVNDDGSVSGRKAVMGALTLYLDFINLFLMLLRLFGDRR